MIGTKEKPLPGTATTYVDSGEKGFSKIEMLIEATGGLSLSQVCAVTGLEGSTIQNWVKRGWVSNPKGKKYDDVHIARILIINALKECVKLENIVKLMSYVNDSVPGGVIKESELFNFLCDALAMLGRADSGGVEAVADAVTKDFVGPKPGSRITVRRALTVMILACVCSDVKRRTDSMMADIMHEYENPVPEAFFDEAQDDEEQEDAQEQDEEQGAGDGEETDESAESASESAETTKVEPVEDQATAFYRSWFRKSTPKDTPKE